MRFTIQQLMAFTHVGSPNTVYNMRRLLKELGYIDYRPARSGIKSQTEYRLLPLGESCANVNGVAGRGAEEGSVTNAIHTDCAFADIKCANTECSANEQPKGFSDSECSDNEHSNNEYSLSENKNELSHTEHSINEHSVCEHSINASSKSEYSVSENSKNEHSESESSCHEGSGGFSGEFSKSERRTDNSPNREEEEKTKNTFHDTSVKYREEVNKNTSININTNNGENPAAGKSDDETLRQRSNGHCDDGAMQQRDSGTMG